MSIFQLIHVRVRLLDRTLCYAKRLNTITYNHAWNIRGFSKFFKPRSRLNRSTKLNLSLAASQYLPALADIHVSQRLLLLLTQRLQRFSHIFCLSAITVKGSHLNFLTSLCAMVVINRKTDKNKNIRSFRLNHSIKNKQFLNPLIAIDNHSQIDTSV